MWGGQHSVTPGHRLLLIVAARNLTERSLILMLHLPIHLWRANKFILVSDKQVPLERLCPQVWQQEFHGSGRGQEG